MELDELLALYDRELRIEIEIPGVQKDVSPNLVRFVRPRPGMNYVGYSSLNKEEVDAVIQEQIEFFTQMDQPFSWHVYDHDTPAILGERLLAHGFIGDDDPDAVMVLALDDASAALLAPIGLHVRRINQIDQLDDVISIEEHVWGGDFSWLKDRLESHLEIPGYLSVFIATVNGQPACSGWVYFHPKSQFAALFGGATLPEYRGLGLYTAVLAARVQEAFQRGYRYLTTGASPMSQPILARNGFRLLTHAHDYEWKERSE